MPNMPARAGQQPNHPPEQATKTNEYDVSDMALLKKLAEFVPRAVQLWGFQRPDKRIETI